MALDRTYYNSLVNDTGAGDGTPVDKAMIDALYDDIDNVLGAIDNNGAIAYAASTTLTIASDAVTLTAGKNVYAIDTEAAAATDNLATITLNATGREARLLILKAANAARVVTLKHGTGNLQLKGGDFAMNDANHRITLYRDGATWYELSRNSATAPGGSDTQVQFNDSGAFGGDAGLTYNKTSDRLTTGSLTTGAATTYINDTANGGMTTGLTINQGSADDEILAFKSSDIAHGVTAIAETDTYALFKKESPTNGGVSLQSVSAGTTAFTTLSVATTDDTTKSPSGRGVIRYQTLLKSGAGVTANGANANMVSFDTNGTTRFILDADGDSHQDVGTAWTNFDADDDIDILNRLAAHVSQQSDPLRPAFAAWLEQSREPLERLELVTFNADGHHFVNMSRLSMLLVGAVRQMGQRYTQQEQALHALALRLTALEDGHG